MIKLLENKNKEKLIPSISSLELGDVLKLKFPYLINNNTSLRYVKDYHYAVVVNPSVSVKGSLADYLSKDSNDFVRMIKLTHSNNDDLDKNKMSSIRISDVYTHRGSESPVSKNDTSMFDDFKTSIPSYSFSNGYTYLWIPKNDNTLINKLDIRKVGSLSTNKTDYYGSDLSRKKGFNILIDNNDYYIVGTNNKATKGTIKYESMNSIYSTRFKSNYMLVVLL